MKKGKGEMKNEYAKKVVSQLPAKVENDAAEALLDGRLIDAIHIIRSGVGGLDLVSASWIVKALKIEYGLVKAEEAAKRL